MKIGDLVKIPSGLKNISESRAKKLYWLVGQDYEDRGTGLVTEVTPYKVHVRWSSGEELAHNHEILELINENR